MEFCNREMSNVVLSLDGRKEINDKMRPFRNGSGSYDTIVPKFQKFAESRGQKNYYVRGTFTRNNLILQMISIMQIWLPQMSMELVVMIRQRIMLSGEEDIPRHLKGI